MHHVLAAAKEAHTRAGCIVDLTTVLRRACRTEPGRPGNRKQFPLRRHVAAYNQSFLLSRHRKGVNQL